MAQTNVLHGAPRFCKQIYREFRQLRIDPSKFCEIPLSIMRFSKVLKASPRFQKKFSEVLGGSDVI